MKGSVYKKLTSWQKVSLGCVILGICVIVYSMVQIERTSVSTTIQKKEAFLAPAVLKPSAISTRVHISEAEQASLGKDEEVILYPIRPVLGESIGTLTIPRLEQIIPIIHGANEDELDKGIGHFEQSVLPGEINNSVLSGHRDTVFRKLGELKIGDKLITETSAGTFTYIIIKTNTVDKDDKTIIVPTDHAVLTVTTCYPFRYIGDAPERYIITADLVEFS